ncbi:hypothetical protein KR074_008374 [Drosophila pseudoananassae]|nr:hypothetical protein KR074_008374 [Drosophila pseudoananassae]
MKVIIIFLLGTAHVLAGPYQEPYHGHEGHYVVKSHDDLESYRNACNEKIRATEDLWAKYKNTDDALTHCYLACVLEKFGVYDRVHGFDVHKLHMQLAGPGVQVDHSDEMHQKIVQCIETHKEGDFCAKAYNAGTCFMNANFQLVSV